MNPRTGSIELPGVGRVSHPAIGASHRAYWRRRRRREAVLAAFVLGLAALTFVVPIPPAIALTVSLIYVGWVLGFGKGWSEGYDRGAATPGEIMREFETVLASLPEHDREKFLRAIEEGDVAGGE